MHSEIEGRSKRAEMGTALRAVAQSMVEYAIVAALVALVAFAAVKALGGTVQGAFTHVCQQVDDANNASSNGGGGGSNANCNNSSNAP